jgi:hypothetical protein
MVFVRETIIPVLLVGILVLALGFEIQSLGGQKDTIVWRYSLEVLVLFSSLVSLWTREKIAGGAETSDSLVKTSLRRRGLAGIGLACILASLAVLLHSPSRVAAFDRLWDFGTAVFLWTAVVVSIRSLNRQGLVYAMRWVSIVLAAILVGSLWAFFTQGKSAFLIKSWPLPNPNHVALIAAIHLVFSLGSLSHRGQALILGQRFEFRELIRHKLIWVSLFQIVLSCAVLVVCESRSVLVVTFVAVLILLLNDHFANLDWLMRDMIRKTSRYSSWFAIALPLVIIVYIAVAGASSEAGSARIRYLLWRDVVVHWLTGDSLRIFVGSGWENFANDYATWRGWESYYPVNALGPESEWLFVLHSTGIFGVVALLLFGASFHYVRPWSRNLGRLSSNWVGRISSIAVLCLAWQSAVDNVFHVPFFWYFSAFVFGGALKGTHRRNLDYRQEAEKTAEIKPQQ